MWTSPSTTDSGKAAVRALLGTLLSELEVRGGPSYCLGARDVALRASQQGASAVIADVLSVVRNLPGDAPVAFGFEIRSPQGTKLVDFVSADSLPESVEDPFNFEHSIPVSSDMLTPVVCLGSGEPS